MKAWRQWLSHVCVRIPLASAVGGNCVWESYFDHEGKWQVLVYEIISGRFFYCFVWKSVISLEFSYKPLNTENVNASVYNMIIDN
jgi:hypothetical protein